MLHIGVDTSRGMHGQVVAFCPLDLPGISRGKPLDKVGQRPLNQGEIFFEDVKLHKKYLLIPSPGIFADNLFSRTFLGLVNSETSVVMSGLAQAALDEALMNVRRQLEGGPSLSKEQGIRVRLFNMFAAVESVRVFVRQVAEYNHKKVTGSPGGTLAKLLSGKATYRTVGKSVRKIFDLYSEYAETPTGRSVLSSLAQSERTRQVTGWGKYGVAAKIMATETAFKVASEAMQILGPRGASKQLPIEKMFRDARASMIEDGVNEMLALAASTDLV
jgi:alkylation response protein AidB-like acyl-CoA dehydrogenase